MVNKASSLCAFVVHSENVITENTQCTFNILSHIDHVLKNHDALLHSALIFGLLPAPFSY